MSWRLLLTEHPDAILRDEITLLLLALLERGGMLTESELQNELKIERPALVKKLLSLHRDKCIEYSRHHIRVSDRGKQIVDRFSLNEEIINDLLSELPLTPDEREAFKEAVREYRNHDFDRYLGSVTALTSWSHTWKLSSLKRDAEPDGARVGSLAILLDDLQDWSVFHFSGHGMEVPQLRIWDLAGQNAPTSEGPIKKAIQWISLKKAVEEDAQPWQRVKILDSPGLGLFCTVKLLQRSSDATVWKDDWSPHGVLFDNLDLCESPREILSCAADYGSEHWGGYPTSRERLRLRRPETSITRLVSLSIGDLLLKLFSAGSFDQLVSRTGVEAATLERLLNQIKEKCDALLSGKVPAEQENVDNPEGG